MIRELIVLGTSSQVPTRHRNHNGYFLRWDDRGLLFDPGEGTQRQMLHAGLRTSGLHHVLITHFHGDHCLGLAGIIQRISLDGVPHPVSVHYPMSGEQFFQRLRHASIFLNRSNLAPQPIEQPGPIVCEPRLTVLAQRLDHAVDTYGYRVQEPDGRRMLPDRLAEAGVFGVDIGRLQRAGELRLGGRLVRLDEVSLPRPGQSMAFVMDTRPCAGADELARGVDLLVCESTYLSTETEEALDRGHMTAEQAGQLAARAGARLLVLTHFSQRYQELEPFLEEARAHHPDVVAVRDGDVIAMPSRSAGRRAP
ncbi:MAG: ribonuclease Z [bacterium]|nr:ribonuclease Z [bacterium]